MTKDVFVSICGLHFTDDGQDPTELIVPGAGDMASGIRGAEMLLRLENPPSAILAGNDLTASGVILRAHERNMRLPEELSVIGFDNSSLAAATYPTLSSVDMCVPQVAAHTARVLLSMISGKCGEVPPIEIKPELVVRNSCSRYQTK